MSDAELHHGQEPDHPYHLVDPSPWPLVGAISAGLLAVGAVLFMHGYHWFLVPVGFVAVILTMAVWWRDVIKEATVQNLHTPIVQIGLRYGMALFIASEVMFFAAFFWAFFDAWLYPKEATGLVWPPEGIEAMGPYPVPFLNTMILLLSGCTVTFAHHCILTGDQRGTVRCVP